MKLKCSTYTATKLDGLRKKDFKIDFFKGSGPGGQHRNKNATAVRITHIVTGISAEATDSKKQSQNKKNAFIRLCQKLVSHYDAEYSQSLVEEMTQETIRTYHAVRNVVKDHRTMKTAPYKQVLDGDIDCLIDYSDIR